jgi:2-polyprenyl-3-methyl-5-hydroxy-6-metoxy-1,4-benzoquinol methylase
MKKLYKCKICNHKKIYKIFKQIDKNLGVPGNFRIFKCEKCKVIFLNPLPEKKDWIKYYPKERYYSLSKIDTSSLKTKLKIFIFKINSENKFILLKLFFWPISTFFRGIEKRGKRILDIGCGSGQFLFETKQIGFEVYGIEPGGFNSQEAINLGIKISKGTIEESEFPKEYFDIITMNHVLEHLEDPKKVLKIVKKILKKDGTLVMGLPNTNSLAFKIFKKNWYQLDVPRHLFNYSTETLNILLKKEGFIIKKIRYNSRPSQFSVSLEYFLNLKNKFLEKFLEGIFLIPTYITNVLRISDQIEVYCVRDKDLN